MKKTPEKIAQLSYPATERKLNYVLSKKGIGDTLVRPAIKEMKESGIAESLDRLPRSGWIIRDIKKEDAETVLEHTFDVARIVALRGRDEVHILMALVHDWAEVETGDATPYDGMANIDFTVWQAPSEDKIIAKIEKERKVLPKICATIKSKMLRESIIAVGLEFEAPDPVKTDRARFVRDCDLYAVGCMARRYADQGLFDRNWLKAFKTQAEKEIKDTAIRMDALRRLS